MIEDSFVNTRKFDRPGALLILDDDPQYCDKIRCVLESENHDVAVAHSETHAFEILDEDPPEVVLIGNLRGEQGSQELCHALKNRRTPYHTAIIMLTPDKDPNCDLSTSGANDFIPRNAPVSTLIARVGLALKYTRVVYRLSHAFSDAERRIQEQTKALSLANSELLAEITRKKLAREALEQKSVQLETVTEAMSALIRTGDYRVASTRVLQGALDQTDSTYGFTGVVTNGRMHVLSQSGVFWADDPLMDEAIIGQPEKSPVEPALGYLFNQVLIQGTPIICNVPVSTPSTTGVSPRLRLINFLGAPIMLSNEVVGMIGLANRQKGYSEEQVGTLDVLCAAVAVIYDSYRRQQREKALEAQLRQAHKMEAVGQLAGGVAHDFNNLLTLILGHSERVLDDLKSDDPKRREIEVVFKAGHRAAALTRQLLAFGRRQTLDSKLLDLNALITDLNKMLRRLIPEDIQIFTDLQPCLGSVLADPGQIEQVLINLVINSRDALPKGGTIKIDTSDVVLDNDYVRAHPYVKQGRYVRIRVTDNGHGMAPDVIAHIFEPFFTTKGPGKGTGLGLSMAFGIIKQSNGYIEAESKPGIGTTIILLLPKVIGAPRKSDPAIFANDDIKGNETILVVEDESELRDLIKEVLESKGYRVLISADGIDALNLMSNENHIDLVLSDLVMPNMKGAELAARIKEGKPNIRILFMSGYAEQAIQASSSKAFIPKPFTPHMLVRKIRECLDQKPEER